MNEVTTSEIIESLDSYEGDNIWQDLILGAGWYDDAKTEELDRDQNDIIALMNGEVLRYNPSKSPSGGWSVSLG